MYIKSLYDPREFDVFLGEGWENWVRVKFMSPSRLEIIKTTVEDLDPSTLQLIYYKLKKYRKKESSA